MPLYARKVSTASELEFFLQGGIRGDEVLNNSTYVIGLYGLVGKTVTFQSPGGAVTFSQGAYKDGFLTFVEIKKQIETAIPTVLVSLCGMSIAIKGRSNIPVSIGSSSAEEGRTLLGFDGGAGGYVSGKVYNAPGGALPRLISVVPSPAHDDFVVITEA